MRCQLAVRCVSLRLLHDGGLVAAVGEAVGLGLLELHLLLLRNGLLRDNLGEALEARCLEPWAG